MSRRTREIGLRAALGANPWRVLGGILGSAAVLTGSRIAAGSALVLTFVALGGGPTGRPADDVLKFVVWLGLTAAVMFAAAVCASIEPALRALRINPMEALRDA